MNEIVAPVLLARACYFYVAEVLPRAGSPWGIRVLKVVSFVGIVGLSVGLGGHVLPKRSSVGLYKARSSGCFRKGEVVR